MLGDVKEVTNACRQPDDFHYVSKPVGFLYLRKLLLIALRCVVVCLQHVKVSLCEILEFGS